MRQNTPYKIEVRGPGPNKHTLAESGRRTETSELIQQTIDDEGDIEGYVKDITRTSLLIDRKCKRDTNDHE